MTEQRKFQAIKGVRDILPPESALWNRVEQTAREVFATYGYGEIRLPIFEQTELFARSIGADTDVVSKEMYSFPDHALWELEGLRTTILLRRPSAHDSNGIRFLLSQTALLVEQVQIALEKGEMPKIADNARAADQLKAVSDRIAKHLVGTSVLQEPTFDLNVDYVRHAAAALRFGDSATLRPEATASVCRAYIEHGMHTWPGNVKLYYIGPMFRREKPQKGRYRQFYQIGAEVLTLAQKEETEKDRRVDAAIDAEVIEMLMAFFEKVGLSGTGASRANVAAGFSPASRDPATEKNSAGLKAAATGAQSESGCTLYINSIGCKECRPKYVEKLRAALVEHINELKADSQRRVETNPLRVLDSKLPEEQAVIEKLPRTTDHLCDACREHYAEVKKQLALRGIAYQENWRLVRGLDYYMRTTFEITAPGLGAQNAVCGGGRYDGLVELLGGPPTKGIGFAIGTDRVILSLQSEAQPFAFAQDKQAAPLQLDVFVAWMGEASQAEAIKIARRLRDAGFSVEVPAEEMKFKKSIGLADKLGARYALIIGENELKEGIYALKRLADGVQTTHSPDELISTLKRSDER